MELASIPLSGAVPPTVAAHCHKPAVDQFDAVAIWEYIFLIQVSGHIPTLPAVSLYAPGYGAVLVVLIFTIK